MNSQSAQSLFTPSLLNAIYGGQRLDSVFGLGQGLGSGLQSPMLSNPMQFGGISGQNQGLGFGGISALTQRQGFNGLAQAQGQGLGFNGQGQGIDNLTQGLGFNGDFGGVQTPSGQHLLWTIINQAQVQGNMPVLVAIQQALSQGNVQILNAIVETQVRNQIVNALVEVSRQQQVGLGAVPKMN